MIRQHLRRVLILALLWPAVIAQAQAPQARTDWAVWTSSGAQPTGAEAIWIGKIGVRTVRTVPGVRVQVSFCDAARRLMIQELPCARSSRVETGGESLKRQRICVCSSVRHGGIQRLSRNRGLATGA